METKKISLKTVVIGLLLIVNTLSAQEKSITVKYLSSEEIKIDGVLDEPIWQTVTSSGDFWEHFPADKNLAKDQTEIKMIFDHKFLYISAKVYTVGDDYNMISLMRDYTSGANDNINFLFDTFSDRNNAFYFSVTPFGVVKDGLLSRGGVEGNKNIDLNWDTFWEAEAKIYDGYYIVELKIPSFAFKYSDHAKSWRFNCYRNDPQSQINTTWAQIPRNRKIQDLGFMGTMVFEEPLEKSRNPIAIIPYALYNLNRDFDTDTKDSKLNAGGDVKLPIGSSSNLDLTFNPDFSSTNINEGSTNITRFELNLPEQRQFFLDNSDLFSSFGKEKQTTPFYSRRIGYGKDTLKNDIEVPIIAGARFTGKINDDLRIGVINVQTASDDNNNIPSNNNLVIAVEQQVFKKSNISAFFINRQATDAPDYVKEKEMYNRVFGADFNYFSENNRWDGKVYLHKSYTPEAGNKDMSAGGYLNYNSRKFISEGNMRYIGGDFKSDLGFIKRTNTAMFNDKFGPKFYPKNEKINMIGTFFLGGIDWQPSTSKITDWNYSFLYFMKFKNQTELRVEYTRKYTYLDKPFDPTKVPGAVPLPVGDYKYGDLFIKYNSDNSKLFSYVAEVRGGTYYSGNKYTGKLTLRYRVQPYFNTYLKATYDYITLPDPHPDATSIVYVGPRFEFTFTKNLYWTTDVQFNSQNEYLGINSRVQWRYRPLSDLFLIYTDGYTSESDNFSPVSRSIFLKVVFWLNI